MADPLTDALSVFVALCPHIRSTRDLVTKIRIELERDYSLELYFREATGQYSYTLLLNDRRVIGWDNARHHPDLPNAPHHFHREDGQVESASLTGDPVQDIRIVAKRINALFEA
ncbi:MAG TPA: DUF6516 family protein [Anaerolineae bacterium]|nr:DUF6516 family protein [Anaerolineae bacterium]